MYLIPVTYEDPGTNSQGIRYEKQTEAVQIREDGVKLSVDSKTPKIYWN